jgi:hypothetical protein
MTPSNIALSYITPPRRSAAEPLGISVVIMRKLLLGLLAAGLFAASQDGCGGGGAKPGDAAAGDGALGIDGRIGPDGGPAIDAAHPGDFIAADVDGTPVRAELMPSAGNEGLTSADLIWASAGTTSTALGWNFYVKNAVGTFDCLQSWMGLFQPGKTFTATGGGSCSITVTQAAPAVGDLLQGTFSATLKTATSTPETAVVTNGAFHVTRNFE